MCAEVNYRFVEERTIINPYNFVQITPKSCKRKAPDYSEKRTGVIHCTLVTRTPLIIPETENVSNKMEHHTYGFFKNTEQQNCIPASSLRGPIRSVYETLTDSCFVTLGRTELITQRTSPFYPFKPALLEFHPDGTLSLYEARRTKIPLAKKGRTVENRMTLINIGHGTEVKNDINLQNLGKKYGFKDGYLCIADDFEEKLSEGVFEKGKLMTGLTQETLHDAYENYKEVLQKYKTPSVNLKIDGNIKDIDKWYNYIDPDKFEKEHLVLPLWYKLKAGQLRLSPASIGRFAYNHSLNDILGGNNIEKVPNSFCPCESREKVCAACNLFGMKNSGDTKTGSVSKVRFTDARLTKSTGEKQEMLSELASPKPSYLPFYLECNGNEIPDYDSADVNIRGRKYYWHSNPDPAFYRADEATVRNATVTMMNTGSEFKFDVYFDGITTPQLNELIWLLCLGNNDQGDSECFKIGHAKPFGFGSVKIIVDSVAERKFDQSGYKTVLVDVNKAIAMVKISDFSKAYPQLMKILDMNALPHDKKLQIKYPDVLKNPDINADKNTFASHHWYSENWSYGEQNQNTIVLPKIDDEPEILALPALEAYLDERMDDNN